MNERSIFMEALEKDTPDQRLSFLNEACAGDAALRQRVEALLHSHEQAGSFLGRPIPERLAEHGADREWLEETQGEPTETADSSEELGFLEPAGKPGSLGRLGHYDVQEVIGRGGMGIVLKAFDEKLHRVVAIKVMAPELAASATARKRFVREAQAAAAVRNEHVIDIHAVEEAPLASPLPHGGEGGVRGGLPYLVMEYVNGLSLQERLKRGGPLQLQEILRIGIQTATGLAAAHAQGLIHRDIKPANILLENGVERVKITDFGLARAADDASLTQTGAVAGTPQYMAPEQARGEPVDHRADIYSLGATLYKLLTGKPPFEGRAQDVLRQVASAEPQPPRRVAKAIPVDVETIVLKAMAEEAKDRYATAMELADDLERFLKDEPIRARRPSVVQRAAKWTKRHRAVVWSAAGALLVAVILLAISTVVIAQQRDLAQEAGSREAAAATQARQERKEAEKERERAEANLRRTREAVDRFFTRVAQELGDVPHMEKVRQALLEDALHFYEDFLKQKRTDPVIRYETAKACLRVAEIQRMLGNVAAMEAPAREAIALLEQLTADDPENRENRTDLASAYVWLGWGCLEWQGRYDEALAELRKCLAVWKKLASDFPAVPDYLHRVAHTHYNVADQLTSLSRLQEAEDHYRQAVAVREKVAREFPNHPDDYSGTLIHLRFGQLLHYSNRSQEAEFHLREMIRLAEAHVAKSPGSRHLQECLIHAQEVLGDLLGDTGRPEEAERLFRRALAACEKLTNDFPNSIEYRRRRWGSSWSLSVALLAMNRVQEAEEAIAQSLAIKKKLLADHSGDPRMTRELAYTFQWQGDFFQLTGRPQQAADAFRQALGLFEARVAAAQPQPGELEDLAWFLATCSVSQFRDPTRAVQLARRALQSKPLSPNCWLALGTAQFRMGKWKDAIEALEKTRELSNGGSASCWFVLAMTHWHNGDKEEARKWYDRGAAWMKKNRSGNPSWRLLQAEAAELLGVKEQKD